MKKKTAWPIDAETLYRLRKTTESPVLEARLQYIQAESFAKYVRMLEGQERVFPSFLPTQSPGRWSMTEPPIGTWPTNALADKRGLPHLRDLVGPDPGTWWLAWDWSAMHARFTAALCDDRDDLAAFEKGWDIHTLTACSIFNLSKPSDPVVPMNDTAWAKRNYWQGGDDRRRRLAKVVRFALLNALDERGVMETKEVEEQGLTVDDLLAAARSYLRSKPGYVAWKRGYIEQCLAAGEARSLYGRRLKLFGKRDAKAKSALSHFLQGTESDILDSTLIAACREYPDAWLVYPTHDSVKLGFPDTFAYEAVVDRLRPIVERSHRIGRHDVKMPATWAKVEA